MNTHRKVRRTVTILGVVALLLAGVAGCGVSSATAPVSSATGEDPDGHVDAQPRIIPVDGDLAEITFALGLGDAVVATDLSATYPPEADARPQIGYQRALSAEPIAAFDPTLILATDLAGPAEALDDLRRLGIDVELIPNEPTFDGALAKIRAMGDVLGVPEAGDALADEVAAEVMGVDRPESDQPPRVLVLYLRGSSVQLVMGLNSPTRWLIEAAGGIDVSAELDVIDPIPVSAETMLRLAPDVLVVPSSGLGSVGGIDGLLAIGGLSQTPAGADRNVLAYDDQLLLGNGPRVGDLLAQLATDLAHP